MILSFRARQYVRLDTLNSKIYPLFQILDTDPGWCKNSGIVACKNSGAGAAAGGVHLACRMGCCQVNTIFCHDQENKTCSACHCPDLFFHVKRESVVLFQTLYPKVSV